MAILAILGGVWRQLFCQKLPVHKSFDVDILGFEKFIYVLWRQIWRLLPKCWLLFGLNTWSHWTQRVGIHEERAFIISSTDYFSRFFKLEVVTLQNLLR